MLKDEVLKILLNKNDYVSGESICSGFGVSRSAVWRAIKKLEAEGYKIKSSTRIGYKLLAAPDMLNQAELEYGFNKSKLKDLKVFYADKVDSTNNWAKKLAEDNLIDKLVCVCSEQTKGRGRRGRDWSSPDGEGVYLSIVLKPDIQPDKIPMLTLAAALATAEAVKECSEVTAFIKWPNDIIADEKKLGGILTEMSADLDGVRYVVCGIGLNVNNECFKEENLKYAVSLFNITQKKYPRKELIYCITEKFLKYSELIFKAGDLKPVKDRYEALLINTGRRVKILGDKDKFEAVAEGITDKGCLRVLKDNGEAAYILSGEVSIRGVYDYI